MEFSKRIFMIVAIMTTGIVAFAMVMMWRTEDLSTLAYLIPAVFAEMAAATGFYFNKAKAENKIKLMQAAGVKPDVNSFE